MKILILTQMVDRNDPVLGFFHGWLKEFAKDFERIEVICLKQGVYDLPSNVFVHSLGKEKGYSRIKYVQNLFQLVFSLPYDGVFVHMNEEYVLLCGWWWRLCNKKVVLWRNFKTGTWMTPLACHLSNLVCFTSPESFTAKFSNAVHMPVGIDTRFFFPPPESKKVDATILFLGRLDAVKNVDVFIEALGTVKWPFQADIYGDPTELNSMYEQQIHSMSTSLVREGKLCLHAGVQQNQARDLYRSHDLYVNLTLSGSFDKTIIEAMASGMLVICSNKALVGILPDECIVDCSANVVSASIDWGLRLPPIERERIVNLSRTYVEQEHSIQLLAVRLRDIFQS